MDENKNLLVVNLFAGPGCGKSTTAAGLFSRLKLAGINCELATEFAKDLTWENRHEALRDQLYITAKQNHKLHRLVGKVDVVVTDSPLLFGAVYSNDQYIPSFQQLVRELFRSYTNINVLLNRVKPYNPAGRGQDEAGARQIDTMVKAELESGMFPYFELPGDQHAAGIIFQCVLSHLNTQKILQYGQDTCNGDSPA